MGYSAGILRWRVAILKKKDSGDRAFGAKTEYEQVACVHANLTWKKGQQSLNEGALDAQDTVMFRMRWNNIVTRDCLLECEGVTYQIQSLHADRREDTIQITATEIVK
jgi:head-tail adaptor